MLFLAETAWNDDATKTGVILCLFQEQPDPDEIYFPLPVNRKQHQIADPISRDTASAWLVNATIALPT